MDDELFELCKEVYERTGWEEMLDCDKPESLTFQYFCYEWDDNNYRTGEKWVADNYRIYMDSAEENRIIPAYTSDYLLEKLKHTADEHAGDQLHVFTDTKGWSAKMTVNYTDEDDRYHFHETSNGYGHDTPLKALLKLVIALDNAGQLKGDK